MADYDSDSSVSSGNDVSTSVVLGYASKEPAGDPFSQLGGHPTFFQSTNPPPSLAKCKCCNSYMSLLLQLNGDLPSRFSDHERRLYLFACRKKQCRRKDGSVRGIRGVRVSKDAKSVKPEPQVPREKSQAPKQDLGSTLFGGTSSQPPANPFSSPSSSNPAFGHSARNPFSAAPAPVSSLAAKPPQTPAQGDVSAGLSATFAQKVRLNAPEPPLQPVQEAREEWPSPTDFPKPYHAYYLDADTEYLPSAPAKKADLSATQTAFMDLDDTPSSSASAQSSKDDAEAEMSIDKAFQQFADRVAENPDQVLRYEFGGAPLLYSRADAVGRLFGGGTHGEGTKVTTVGRGLPKCGNCGGKRVFELQLMPQAIAELEVDEEAATLLATGMEWGTVLLGVCERDCVVSGGGEGAGTGYFEEWIGVQWEEVVERRR